jgi:hypothetical protein
MEMPQESAAPTTQQSDAGSPQTTAAAAGHGRLQPREIENTINTSEHMVVRNELSQ